MKKRNAALLLAAGLLLMSALAPAKGVYAAKAKTKTVYVVTSATSNGKTDKFTYNKNGLLTRQTGDTASYSFSYNKKSQRLSKEVKKENTGTATATYSYDKKNRLAKEVLKYSDGFGETKKFYYSKKNRVSKLTYKESGPEAFGGLFTSKYSYNKKGYVSKVNITSGKDYSYSYTYTYDGKGNIKKVSYKTYSSGVRTIKNIYKSGKLSRQEITDRNGGNTNTTKITYTCKKIKVPAGYYTVVRAQQRAICNIKATENTMAYIELGVYEP